jgi:hypothetical protein
MEYSIRNFKSENLKSALEKSRLRCEYNIKTDLEEGSARVWTRFTSAGPCGHGNEPSAPVS